MHITLHSYFVTYHFGDYFFFFISCLICFTLVSDYACFLLCYLTRFRINVFVFLGNSCKSPDYTKIERNEDGEVIGKLKQVVPRIDFII